MYACPQRPHLTRLVSRYSEALERRCELVLAAFFEDRLRKVEKLTRDDRLVRRGIPASAVVDLADVGTVTDHGQELAVVPQPAVISA